MSLPIVGYYDASDFANGGYWDSISWYPGIDNAAWAGYSVKYGYYDRLDCLVCVTNLPTYPMLRMDANFLDNGAGSNLATTGLTSHYGVSFGEWNTATNTQKAYAHGSTIFTEIDVDNMSSNGQVWSSEWGPRGQLNGKGSGEDGYWTSPPNWCTYAIFEELGVALVPCGQARITSGDVDPASFRPFLVELSTGDAIENVPIFTRYVSSPNDEYEKPPLPGGESAYLSRVQFVPDADNTPENPKGYLLFHEGQRTADAGTWILMADWNPNGVSAAAGEPEREHCLERLVSKFTVSLSAYPDGCPSWDEHPIVVRSSDDKWIAMWGDGSASSKSPGDVGYIIVATTPAVAKITPPRQLHVPETNRNTEFVSSVVGDLGERISGISVAWTIEKGSQHRETLSHGGGGAGEVLAVLNPPIDENDLDPGVEMYQDDIEMTSGWSVTDAAAGEITVTAPHPVAGSVYKARYRHLQNPASGAHGTLVTPASRSDVNGNVTCLVNHPDDDDLVSEWNVLTATEQ